MTYKGKGKYSKVSTSYNTKKSTPKKTDKVKKYSFTRDDFFTLGNRLEYDAINSKNEFFYMSYPDDVKPREMVFVYQDGKTLLRYTISMNGTLTIENINFLTKETKRNTMKMTSSDDTYNYITWDIANYSESKALRAYDEAEKSYETEW